MLASADECQVVGARLQVTGPSMVDDINNNLPADIRVMSVSRVTKGFNAKVNLFNSLVNCC